MLGEVTALRRLYRVDLAKIVFEKHALTRLRVEQPVFIVLRTDVRLPIRTEGVLIVKRCHLDIQKPCNALCLVGRNPDVAIASAAIAALLAFKLGDLCAIAMHR